MVKALPNIEFFFLKTHGKLASPCISKAYVGEVEVASGTFDVGPWREGIFFIDAGIGSHSVGSSRSVITNGNPPPPAHQQESAHSTVLCSYLVNARARVITPD